MDQNATYYSAMQVMCRLIDTQHLFCELGRGSGKTTHIMAPRIDRVQHSMPGSVMVFAAATYKSIFDNLLPGVMEYFTENYKQGLYFEVGKRPPAHFKQCNTWIEDWKHTISFCNGTVIQFVSCDRPESMLGKSAVHLFVDEMIRIPEDKFIERVMPSLRGNRALYGLSPYFMGITGTSSTPNFQTDEDWFCRYEENMNEEHCRLIARLALEIEKEANPRKANIDLLNSLRRGETFYLRASSFSNLKILGIEYINNQIKTIKSDETLLTSIFGVRQNRVRDLFFGKFGKQHVFSDSYRYERIDRLDAASGDFQTVSQDLKHYDPNLPLIFGYDPGGFTSIVVAQRDERRHVLRVIKNFYKIYPEQQQELAESISRFFAGHKNRVIMLHYDRAANQHDPHWKKSMPVTGDLNDTDAIMLKQYLERYGWRVQLMSLGQPTIYYSQHLRLLNRLFGDDSPADKILIDENECAALIASIYHSPLKRTDGKIQMDKSSEKLPYAEQAYNSTQIASAFMYMLWGLYARDVLPRSDIRTPDKSIGGFTAIK